MSDPHDIASFGAYYQNRAPSSKEYIRRLLSGTGANWQDIHDEVWLRVLKKILEPDFTPRASLDQYLNGCLFNAAYDYLRKNYSEEQPTDFDEHPWLLADTSRPVIDQVIERLGGSAGTSGITGIELDLKDPASWDNRSLADAVEALAPRQRVVIMFWAWKDPRPTIREIAKEFEIAENTAKTHFRRALMKLRQELGATRIKEKEEESN